MSIPLEACNPEPGEVSQKPKPEGAMVSSQGGGAERAKGGEARGKARRPREARRSRLEEGGEGRLMDKVGKAKGLANWGA